MCPWFRSIAAFSSRGQTVSERRSSATVRVMKHSSQNARPMTFDDMGSVRPSIFCSFGCGKKLTRIPPTAGREHGAPSTIRQQW